MQDVGLRQTPDAAVDAWDRVARGLPMSGVAILRILLTMKGATFSADPHPEPPKCFLAPDPQLRAAVLSDDNRLQTFIMSRPGSATRGHETAEHRQAA